MSGQVGINRKLIFLKLGGALITVKDEPETAREEVIQRAAAEVKAALEEKPSLQLVLGHGSGSFGHYAAQQHGLVEGAPPNWWGYAVTGAAAARLNRLVADIFLGQGVPVVTVQPSASAVCRQGRVTHLEVPVLRELLCQGLVPLVYGDVALDDVWGHTIISTEVIFAYLAHHLRPGCIVLASEVGGVFTSDPHRDPQAEPIAEITPATLSQVEDALGASAGYDVTGGMWAKVRTMVALVERLPHLEVYVVSGEKPDSIRRALIGEPLKGGTRIEYSTATW